MTAIQTRLEQDHREIEALLERLALAGSGPSEALRETFNELEGRLMGHMEAEEEYLLPLVGVSHAAEAERTRVEHARIRQLISELGLAIELHAARQPKVVELIQVLREHSAREDDTVYRLASEKVSTAVEHRVLATLKAAARAALSAVKPAPAAGPGEPSDPHRAHP